MEKVKKAESLLDIYLDGKVDKVREAEEKLIEILSEVANEENEVETGEEPTAVPATKKEIEKEVTEDAEPGIQVPPKEENKLETGEEPAPVATTAGEIEKEITKDKGLLEDTAYQKYFKSMLAKWGVKSPSELPADKKKAFFRAVQLGWVSGKGKSK